MNLVPIPMSVAQLKVPSTKLAALPPGAGYSVKSGQATVNLKKLSNDSIEVTATCDSLARQVILLTEELARIRNETELKEVPPQVVNEPTGWQWFWIRTGQLAVAGLILIVIKRYLKRRKL